MGNIQIFNETARERRAAHWSRMWAGIKDMGE
jgi:hypothetical protein